MIGLLLIGLSAFGFFGFVMLRGLSKAQAGAEAKAEQTLDEAFDGSENVTFAINVQSPKYETVVLGAKARGYKLIHQADNTYGPHTLIFEKMKP